MSEHWQGVADSKLRIRSWATPGQVERVGARSRQNTNAVDVFAPR